MPTPSGPAPALSPDTAGTAGTRGADLLAAAVGPKLANRRDDVETVQRLLNHSAGLGRFGLATPLVPDGIFGRKSYDAIAACQHEALGIGEPDGIVDPGGRTLRTLCADIPEGYSPLLLSLVMLAAAPAQIDRFAVPIARCFADFDLASPLRQAHFLAQIGHESGELRFQEEIASGSAYEGRADLGNDQPGDGMRFKGRGLIQLTGRANYTRFGDAIDRRDEVLATPGIVAEELDLCVAAAGWFWSSNKLNAIADRDDLRALTKRINGGTNGIDHRRALLARAKSLYGIA